MARYIDADKLLEQVNSLEQLARKRVYDTPTNSPAYERYATQYQEREKMLAILKAQPTADVAPKSEVARKICCEIEEEIVAALESNYKARTEYYTKLRYVKEDGEFINTVNGKIAALRGIEGFVEELKKKYTGEQT